MCSYTFTYLAVHVCAFIDRNFMFRHSILRSEIRQKLKEDVETIRADNEGFKPGLAIVQIGDRSDSTVYIKSKVKAAEEVSQLFLDCLSFNPLHPNIINYILFSALHVFLMVLDGRI